MTLIFLRYIIILYFKGCDEEHGLFGAIRERNDCCEFLSPAGSIPLSSRGATSPDESPR